MNKDGILQGFLSKDPKRILSSAGEINSSVITNRGLIEELYPHLPQIREAVREVDCGGGRVYRVAHDQFAA